MPYKVILWQWYKQADHYLKEVRLTGWISLWSSKTRILLFLVKYCKIMLASRLTNVAPFVVYFFPASPANLVSTLDSTRGHSPTQALPVSVPASPPTAPGQPLTWVSPISISSSWISAMPLYPTLVPIVWLSLPFASDSSLTTLFQSCRLFHCSILFKCKICKPNTTNTNTINASISPLL